MGSNMSTLKKIAILSLAAAAAASPVNLSPRAENAVAATSYQQFRGDGSVTSGWPPRDRWISSIDQMWDINYPDILASNPNHADEAALIKQAIAQAAAETNIDARFILAIIMQESTGKIRVATTSYADSGANPGLMQSRGGPSCAADLPCSYDTILGMIMQGVQNGPEGINLKSFMEKSGKPEPANYYWAARLYNSGANSMTAACNDNLSCRVTSSTTSYASDIANRLRGLTDERGARGGGNPVLFKDEAC